MARTCKGFRPTHNFNESAENLEVVPEKLTHLLQGFEISVVIPNAGNWTDDLKKELIDSTYYKIQGVYITEFINKNFIQFYINHGYLSAICIPNKVDVEPTFSINGSRFHIRAEQIRSFAAVELRENERYEILDVDLKDERVVLNSYYREKTKQFLKRLGKFDFILKWIPSNKNVCPSSIALYFEKLGATVSQCEVNTVHRKFKSMPVPVLFEEGCGPQLLEWLGMLILDALPSQENGENNDYLSSYKIPEPNMLSPIQHIQFKGLFDQNIMLKIYKQVTNILKVSKSPWISMYIKGFADAPVVWKNISNNYFMDGDNILAIFFKQNGEALVCTNKTNPNY